MVPWWAKIAAKLVLARLPVSGGTWQRLGVFSPGGMLEADYAIAVFERHYKGAGAPGPGFSFLELGPGDSLASAVIGRAYGAAQSWLIDQGSYVSRDPAVYDRLIAELRQRTTPGTLPDDLAFEDLEGLLRACGAEYHDQGLASLARIPDGACDMVFSQAVLEHVPREDFTTLGRELYRLLKPGGVATHAIDFRDHLGGGLNNLRFSPGLWEAPWFARRSGFYTNRLRLSEMCDAFHGAGFDVEIGEKRAWDRLPLPHGALHPAFRSLEDDDLLTRSAFVRLSKP